MKLLISSLTIIGTLLAVYASRAVVTFSHTGTIEGERTGKAISGIHKIKHVVIFMQENRSFDEYFGTFPDADGLPRDKQGQFTVCLPDPRSGGCDRPYHDPADQNAGAEHLGSDEARAADGGKMDGFVAVAEQGGMRGCILVIAPSCNSATAPDVMGYHDGADIPNYWAYAKTFVLQDHMFSSTSSWTLPTHLYLVSGWTASCTRANDPFSCVSDPDPALTENRPYGLDRPDLPSP